MTSTIPRAVVVNSIAGRDAHMRIGYKPKQWELIPNGIDTKHFNPANMAKDSLIKSLGLTADATLIAHSARFHPMKDHAAFLKAASVYAKINRNAIFVMIGSGVTMDNEPLRREVIGLGLEKRAHLLGEQKDVKKIIGSCDLFCSSSSYGEGFSNVVAEAMASGVPCVVTDVGDSAMIVGDTGMIVPVGDTQAMANAFEEMLSLNKNRRLALGVKARGRIVEKFSLDRVIARYENLYTAITEGIR